VAPVVTSLLSDALVNSMLTGKLLAVLVNGLADRNAAVRKSYALAIGSLVKVRLLVVSHC